jgi:lipopolysaccharide heptosyltransferase II
MIPDAKKILVIKLRAIGDVVLSTSVLPGIRRAYPDSEIHFLTEIPSVPAVEGNPDLDRVVVLPRQEWAKLSRRNAWRASLDFTRMLRREKYDLVFDLFGNPRSAFLTWITGAPVRVGYAFRGRKLFYNRRVPPRGDRIHELEFNLDALKMIGIPVQDARPLFPVAAEDKKKIREWLGEQGLLDEFRVGMHVWGSWEAKRWDLEKFAVLADRMGERYRARVILLWGPGEQEHAVRVQEMARNPVYVAPETSLKELGALLSQCALVVANDSGPMHIAAALGVPTVGIFGPTSWKLQGPYGDSHGVAYKEGLTCLGCNRLSCGHLSCMRKLGVKAVLDVVDRVMKETGLSVPVTPSSSQR